MQRFKIDDFGEAIRSDDGEFCSYVDAQIEIARLTAERDAAFAVGIEAAAQVAWDNDAKAFREKYEVDYKGRQRWDRLQLRSAENKCMNIIAEDTSEAIRALATTDQRAAFDRLVAERVAEELAKSGEPVAWQWRSKIGPSGWGSGALSISDPGEMNDQYEKRPLYAHQAPASAGVTVKPLAELFAAAEAEAMKAMRKFPQPNYVISKVAEEAGEVVKAAIHCAEGRETPENVIAEIRQAMAMLIRLYIEGDQVHGLAPCRPLTHRRAGGGLRDA